MLEIRFDSEKKSHGKRGPKIKAVSMWTSGEIERHYVSGTERVVVLGNGELSDSQLFIMC